MKFHLTRDTIAGLTLIGFFSILSFLPNTLANWNYNYFQFLPGWFVAIAVIGALLLVVFESKIVLPQPLNRKIRWGILALLAIMLPLCLYFFRTRIHLFDGDAGGGSLTTDCTITWRDFVPPIPYFFSKTGGRLDTYGLEPFVKYATSHGWLSHLGGNVGLAGSQLYCIAVGALDILLAIFLFRKNIWATLVVLTFPFVHNLFGNADSYPVPIGFVYLFIGLATYVLSLQEIHFRHLLLLGSFWLLCGYAHPLFGFSGFLVSIAAARWFNGLHFKWKTPEWLPPAVFALLFFCVIRHMYTEKLWFGRALDLNPPIVSLETVLNWLNVGLFPVLPIAYFVLTGQAPRHVKRNLMLIFCLQFACFAPATFRQGANDVFAYMIGTASILIPWFVTAIRFPLQRTAWCAILACNLLHMVPLVAVHSSERTIDRAMATYPVDNCVHNTVMSWQTHLGLKMGDNQVDSPALAAANLRVFRHGAQHAQPEGFRGGNYLYYVAFHYHYGRFAEGRRLLTQLIRQNPQLVRNFLSQRPAFIYLNRQKLWDDLLEIFPNKAQLPQLKTIIDQLREKAKEEVFCLRPPSYAKCPY